MIGTAETLGTIWEIPVHLGEQIRPVILEMDPLKATGRKRVDPRRMVDGTAFRMRSGCQWNRLSKELGDDAPYIALSRHFPGTFQRGVELGGARSALGGTG